MTYEERILIPMVTISSTKYDLYILLLPVSLFPLSLRGVIFVLRLTSSCGMVGCLFIPIKKETDI